ncbi:MAG: hypothetical protein JWL76_1751 [Thermoleophilia bacterium]|nr:hypothetical protein [Thermoleophilia bacterium]
MPIPMPPTPAPYIAPDLHPIVALPTAQLNYVRDRNGRITDRGLAHGLWVGSEGAPLELRFHRREDGSIWGEQATYVDGDRAEGAARASAAAHTEPLSRRLIGGMGIAANFVRYTVIDSSGAEIRQWSTPLCGTFGSVRLDRANSPDEPTYPSTWEGCERDFEGVYVLGRLTGLDRGWAMQLPARVATFKPPRPGKHYQLRVELDPLDGIADSNPANDSVTIPLTVTSVVMTAERDDDCKFCEPPGGIPIDPVTGIPVRPNAAAARSHVGHAAPASGTTEPEWYLDKLRVVEAGLEQRRAVREAGPAPREGEPAPAAPANVDLPDLQAAPSYGIHTDTITRRRQVRDLLRFGALTWNAGPGPLEVEAFRESGTTLAAYQVFSRDGKRADRQARGTLVWHDAPGHNHFHFNAFAGYTLTKLDGTKVRDGGKHSWCIVDTDQVDTTRPGTNTGNRFGAAGGCGSDSGSLWARLSLSVGSGDYYGPDIAGQSFDITTVPNGVYHVRVEANPTDVIAEANFDNNVSVRTVTLGGTRGHRTVVARAHKLINDEALDDFDDCKNC